MAKRKQLPKDLGFPKNGKQPIAHIVETIGHPKWKFSKFVRDSKYQLPFDSADVFRELFSKLKNFETMTWQSIMQSTHGTGGSNSHFISIDSLSPTGRGLIENNSLFEYSEGLFSLRLQGAQRLLGYLFEDTLFIFWYDPDHSTVLTKKKHT